MVKITICIGSSCHVKGSRKVVESLQSLISDNGLEEKIDLGGTFCLGQCQSGVCVDVDGEICSVTPENVDEFFAQKVLSRV